MLEFLTACTHPSESFAMSVLGNTLKKRGTAGARRRSLQFRPSKAIPDPEFVAVFTMQKQNWASGGNLEAD